MRLAVTLAGLLVAAPLFGGGTSTSKHAAVTTGSRYATNAALAVLREGGNAADAAITAAFVLSVARPDAAGIGGGGMLVYHDREHNATWVVDFREAAPAKLPVVPKDGPLTGVSAAAMPGLVRGLADTHRRFGSRPWKDLVFPASQLADEGFVVDETLSSSIARSLETNHFSPHAAAIFAPEQKAPAPGQKLVQKQLAATLAKVAKSPAVLVDGALAIRISDASAKDGGVLALRDFREYRAEVRAPLSVQVGAYSLVTAPPPSSGGMILASTLAISSGLDMTREGAESVRFVHLSSEAARRAMLDARRNAGDPAYTRVALDHILAPERLSAWRATIDPARATPSRNLTMPGPLHTTHVAVIDAKGNVASLTLSLSGEFGSGWVAGDTGILLNGAMNDFRATVDRLEGENTAPLSPNNMEPKKRPATPLAPCILFFAGKPRLAIGAAGGEAIPQVLFTVLLRYVALKQGLDQAIAAPRIFRTEEGDQLLCEKGRWPEETLEALRAIGHGVLTRDSIGEINAIAVTDAGLVAVADPRGQGATGGN
ncbi:MAG: gamma-glutamyltransferase [Thermoanaerobaculia bacterium]|jgi:gamma-glutamyltranspeptidase/glutathione hydrolase